MGEESIPTENEAISKKHNAEREMGHSSGIQKPPVQTTIWWHETNAYVLS